jgi:diaminohydroxyphosphoribosylaminopyrimidine deaminase/5-amino-6-(5-phosphoribosylamino)uracil reductase
MQEALRLARLPKVPPYPNPWVGCVVVQGRKIVGRGYHFGPGSDHAEVGALREAGPRARNAAMYVTLEPCCHYGQTPPCTDAIVKAGIRKVFYALRDPNPAVGGRGAEILRSHGVAVNRGLCAREAAGLNEVYFKYRATGLPFVTAKVAASLDGKIATRTGRSQWITDGRARNLARALRAQNQAILVGINTVLADDPHLGSRVPRIPGPWRVVLDSRLRIPTESRVVKSGKCIVACTTRASSAKARRLEQRGVKVWKFRGRRVPLELLLRRLALEGIISLLVEGGGEVLGSFFDARAVDRVCWFLAPIIIGSAASRAAVAGRGVSDPGDAVRLREVRITPAGNAWLLQGSASRWALA